MPKHVMEAPLNRDSTIARLNPTPHATCHQAVSLALAAGATSRCELAGPTLLFATHIRYCFAG